LIEILKLQAATLAEQNADAQLTALIVRRQAQAILASADQVETLTNAAGSAFSEVAAQGPERVARKVAKAIETYRSSAVVEREVAGTFNAAANDLAAREIDWDRVNQRLEVLRPLVERRAALHKQRLEALTP
jgi:hypothetical protein